MAILTDLEPILAVDFKTTLRNYALCGSLLSAAVEALNLDSHSTEHAILLFEQWAQGDFSIFPSIKVAEARNLGNARAAYATAINTILIQSDWIRRAAKEELETVLAEEIGHFLDAYLNASDSPGDEGELFVERLLKKPTSPEHINTIKQENDGGVVFIEGKSVLVEFATGITITAITDDIGIYQGIINANGTSDDPTPLITGSLVNQLGPDERLIIFDGETRLGLAVFSTPTNWSYRPNLSANPNKLYTITARIVNSLEATLLTSSAYLFTFDTSIPSTTASISSISDNEGLISGIVPPGGRSDDTSPTITGTTSTALLAGETVQLFNGNVRLGEASVDTTSNTWSYTPSLAPSAGTSFSFVARVADAAGNTSGASLARRFILDTTAPITTASISDVIDNVSLFTGSIPEGGSTNDTTPTLKGSITSGLAVGDTVRIFNGATLLGTASVNNGLRTWTYTPKLPNSPGSTYSFIAVVADAAGNLSTPSTSRALIVDTEAPSNTAVISSISDNNGLISGIISQGGRSDDTSPTITGFTSTPLQAGETIQIFNSNALLGEANYDSTKNTWNYTPSLTPSAGTPLSFIARVADAAGNLGTSSLPYRFTLDTTAPSTTATITDVIDNVSLFTGSVPQGGVTNDITPTLSGTVSTALVGGETVRIFNGSTLLGTATVNNAARTWTYTPTLSDSLGTSYSFIAVVADAAGNLGMQSASRNLYFQNTALSNLDPLSNPFYTLQWHLANTGQGGGLPGIDANVELAWNQSPENGGIFGRNVTIAIVDDGLQWSHPDLITNYRADGSYDYNFRDADPSPTAADPHGTAVAGVAAAAGNNALGGVGIAPMAGLSGVRLIAGPSSDSLEASALNHALQINSIFSNSWGPADTGDSLSSMGPITREALRNGVSIGRGGKGAIYTWAGGNGRENGDNSNYDGFANSPYVIAVAATDNRGRPAYYSEPGANLLVSAPSSGGTLGIVTTDLIGPQGYNGLSDNDYTNTFGGTSSATPLVSGVIALMLEANPSLSWRDVMHILVNSSRKINPLSDGWQLNGAGHSFHHDYGYGLIDANAAVTLSKNWSPVGSMVSQVTGSAVVNAPIPDLGGGPLTSTITINDNIKIESVEILFNATHSFRGDLAITLTSPSGSTSILATEHADKNDDYNNWTFSSRVHWDELSAGDWTLKVEDMSALDTGTLLNWGLTFNGSAAPTGSPTTSTAGPAAAAPNAIQTTAKWLSSGVARAKSTAKVNDISEPDRSNKSRRKSSGIDELHKRESPGIESYIALIEDRLLQCTEEQTPSSWTVARYRTQSLAADNLTGLFREFEAKKIDSVRTADWHQTTQSLLNSGANLDYFSVAIPHGFSQSQFIDTLTQSLGKDVAYFYPDHFAQQASRTALMGPSLG